MTQSFSSSSRISSNLSRGASFYTPLLAHGIIENFTELIALSFNLTLQFI